MTVILYKYGAACGLPDLSPFCIKLETFLRMAHIPYRTHLGFPSQAPKGKLPYLEYDGKMLFEPREMIDELTQHFDVSLDATLEDNQIAIGQAFRSMIEEHLYFAILYFRWQDPIGWDVYERVVAQTIEQTGAPAWLSARLTQLSRNSMLKALLAQGIGQLESTKVAHIACQQISTISNLLSMKRYFLDERPSSIDATVYAFLESVLIPPFENPLRQHILSLPNLVDYCRRMREQFWRELGSSVSSSRPSKARIVQEPS